MPFDAQRELKSPTGATLNLYVREAAGPSRGVIQVNHGLAEHAARYARFADFMAEKGFATYAHDHRGHGQTASPADLGFFAERDGWAKCVADLWALNRRIAADLPGQPIVFLGHSMGSFLGQSFVAAHSDAIAACVFSGSNGPPPS